MINSVLSASLLDYLTRVQSDASTPQLNLSGKLTKWIIGRQLTDSDVPELCKFLENHTEIVRLKLAGNRIGNDGLTELITARTSIRYLNICNCAFDWRFLQLLAANASRVKLTVLKINRNFIGRKGCYYLSKFVETNTHLTQIDLSHTNHTILGVSYLIRSLQHQSSLTSLDLSHIVPDSSYCLYYDTKYLMELLSEFLKTTEHLAKLRLQNCRISGYDFQILLDGLVANKTLVVLDLSDNFIGDFGFELLARWLSDTQSESPPLTKLSLRNNKLSCVNFESDRFAFLKTSKLQAIDLSDNQIEPEQLSRLLNNVKLSQTLRKLFVWGNKLTSANFKEIQRIAKNRKSVPVKIFDIDVYECNNNYHGTFKSLTK